MRLLKRCSMPAMVALLLWSALVCSEGAMAQQTPPPNREVTVQNETDLALQNLYIHPPNATDRGTDRLGQDVVAPGATQRLRLGRLPSCTQDIVAIFQDATEDVRRRVDICRNPRIVFGDPTMPTLEVAIANRADQVLRELYASARGPEAWGPDRLGAEVIDANGSFALRMRTRDCIFDLRAVYADDREEVKSRIDLCANRNQVFDRSGIPRPPTRTIALVNRHLAAVQEVYVSASSESDWGPDRLGSTVLAMGAETTLEIEGECEADIRVVFPNGGAEERREIDICANPRLVLAPGWVIQDIAEPSPAAPEAAAPSTGLRLRNAGALPMVEVYAVPAGGARGPDLLGSEVLGLGETLDLPAGEAGACTGDLVVVFRDGRELRRAGVDLCRGGEVELP